MIDYVPCPRTADLPEHQWAHIMRPARMCNPRLCSFKSERMAKTDRRVKKSSNEAPSFSEAFQCTQVHPTNVKEPYGRSAVSEPYGRSAVPTLSLRNNEEEWFEIQMSCSTANKWLKKPITRAKDSTRERDETAAMRAAHEWQDSLSSSKAASPALPSDPPSALSAPEAVALSSAPPAPTVVPPAPKRVTFSAETRLTEALSQATRTRRAKHHISRRRRSNSRAEFAETVDVYKWMRPRKTKEQAIAMCGILFGDKSAVKPRHYHTLHRWAKDAPKAVIAVSRESPMWTKLNKHERKSGRASIKALRSYVYLFYSDIRQAYKQRMAVIRRARQSGELQDPHGGVDIFVRSKPEVQAGNPILPKFMGGKKTFGSFNPRNEDVTDDEDGQPEIEQVELCKSCKAHPNKPNSECQTCQHLSIFERLASTYKDFGNTDVFRILMKVLMFMRAQTTLDKALILADTAAEWVARNEQAQVLVDIAAKLLSDVRSDLLARMSDGSATDTINQMLFSDADGGASSTAEAKLQSGDAGGLSGLIGGWSTLTSILSDKRIKQITTAVCALLSVTAAASCGQNINYDFIKSAVEISDNLTRTASPFDRILQGVDNFMSLVYAFATKGWKGLKAWVNPSSELILMEELLHSVLDEVDHFDSLDMPGRMAFKTNMDKLKKWYTDNVDWMRSASVKDFIMKTRATKLLNGIRAGERKLSALERGKNRPKPLTIALLAGSDVGKTTIQYRLTNICLSAAGVPVTKENLGLMTYYWPPGCEFADGLHHGVGCVIFDDIGCIHSAKQPEGDPAAVNFHRVANCAPFQPPMAALENKSNIACHPQLCILSSNVTGFGFGDTFKVPSIMDRRINHVVVTRPKREYSKGGVLDPEAAAKWNDTAKENGGSGPAENFWEVRVYSSAAINEIVSTPGQKIPTMKVSTVWTLVFPQAKEGSGPVGDSEWAPIDDYYSYLADYAESYYAEQEKVKNMIESYQVDVDPYFTTRREKKEKAQKALLEEQAKDLEIRNAAAAAEAERVATARKGWFQELRDNNSFPGWPHRRTAPPPAETEGPTSCTQSTDPDPWALFQAISKSDPAVELGQSPAIMQAADPESLNAAMEAGARAVGGSLDYLLPLPADEHEESGGFEKLPSQLYSYHPPQSPLWLRRLMPALNAVTHAGVTVAAAAAAGTLVYYGCARVTPTVFGSLFGSSAVNLVDTTYDVAYLMCIPRGMRKFLIAIPKTLCFVRDYTRSAIGGVASATKAICNGEAAKKAYTWATAPLKKLGEWVTANKEVLKMIAMAAVVTIGVTAWYLRKGKNQTDTGEMQAKDDAPKPGGDSSPPKSPTSPPPKEGDSRAHQNDTIKSYSDFGKRDGPGPSMPVTSSSQKAQVDHRPQLVNKVKENTYVIGLYDKDKIAIPKSAGHALFLATSCVFVANAHVLARFNDAAFVSFRQVGYPNQHAQLISTRNIKLSLVRAYTDLVVGKLDRCSIAKKPFDLLGYLPNEEVTATLHVKLVSKTGAAEFNGLQPRKIEAEDCIDGEANVVMGRLYSRPEANGYTRAFNSAPFCGSIESTSKGDCGLPYVTGTSGDDDTVPFCIVGIHTGIQDIPKRGLGSLVGWVGGDTTPEARELLITPLHGVREVIAQLNGAVPMPGHMAAPQTSLQQGAPPSFTNLQDYKISNLGIPVDRLEKTVHFKCVTNWLDPVLRAAHGWSELKAPVTSQFLGGWPGFRSDTNTTKFTESPLYRYIDFEALSDRIGIDVVDDKVLPDFRGRVGDTPDGTRKLAACRWQALLPMATQKPFDQEKYQRFKAAADMYKHRLLKYPEWRENLFKLTTHEACNGIDGLRAMEALKWTTSSGHPWSTAKTQLFEFTEDGKRTPGPEVAQCIKNLEKNLSEGLVYPVFSAQVKDEPISVTKNDKGKFRVFMMSPVDFTVVSRKYLMSFVRCMALFPFTFGAAVGMNCHSEQWTQLAHFLGVGTDTEIFDGDYEDFDKQMCVELLQVVRELIVDLHRGVFSDADLKTMDNILRVTYSPVVNFFGTLLKLMAVNPSGNMITTQGNCIAGNIYLRYVFYMKHGHLHQEIRLVGEHFDRLVCVITYGDDLLASVKVGFSDMFNCKIVQDVLAEIGVGFTDAEKNTNTKEFREHHLVTFLKRAFKRVEIEGDTFKYQYSAPLDAKSIGKMLHYNQTSAVPLLDVLKSTLQSVGSELYFQGKDPFEIVRAVVEDGLRSWAEEQQVPLTVKEYLFKPYEYYDQWYQESVQFENGTYTDPWCPVPDDVHSVKHVDDSPLKAEMYPENQTDGRMGSRCAEQAYPNACSAGLFSSRSAPYGARISDLPHESHGELHVKENAPANRMIIIQSGDPAPLTEFNDSSGVNTETVPGAVNATFKTGGMPGVGQLSNWFNRPILHKSLTWNEDTMFSYTFNPWLEFWTKDEMVKKLAGYSRLRSKMHIKLVINSTPFQYSMGVMSYKPMNIPGKKDSFSGGNAHTTSMPAGAALSVLTTRPHVFFYPQLQEEAEMVLPFIYHKNWIEITPEMNEFDTLGWVSVSSVVPLKSAAGASSVQGIEVAIYVWAEDVEVSGPSYVLQSGDPMPVRPKLIGDMASTDSGTADRLVLDASNSVSDEGIDHMDIRKILDRDVAVAVVPWAATDGQNKALWMADVCPGYSWGVEETGAVTGQKITRVQAIPSAQIAAAFNLWNGDITYSFKFIGSAFHTGRLKLVYDPAGLTGYSYDADKDPRVITKIWDVRNSPNFSFTVPWASSKAWLQTGRLGGLMCKRQRKDRMWSGPTLPLADYTHDSSRCNGTILVSVLNPLISNDPSTATNIVVSVNMGGVDFMDPVDLDVPISFQMLQSGDPPDLSGDPEMETHNSVPAVGIVPASNVYGGEKVRSLKTLMRRSSKYRYVKLMQQMQTRNNEDIYSYGDWYPHPPIINATSVKRSTGWSTSLLFPVMPLPPGRLSADVAVGTNTGELDGGTFIPTGLTEGVLTRCDEAAQMYVNQTERLCTPTAFFSPSYVGWRGSHIYKAKVAYNGHVTDWQELSLCRSQFPLSEIVKDMHTCMPLVTNIGYGSEHPQGQVGAIIRTVGSGRGCYMLNPGGAGMTQTNVKELPYTDAEFPYYSSYRMHPCGPLANYRLAYEHEKLSWNHSDLDTRPLGATACLRSVVHLSDGATNENVGHHPDVQLYHKVGSDFTLYFYLSVPTMWAYADTPDGQLSYPWIATQ